MTFVPVAEARAEALDRTLVLMRDYIGASASEADLLAALNGCRVAFVADATNASIRQGQVALITAVLLCARMGMQVRVVSENVALEGIHAPLTGTHLLDALEDVGNDLIPGSAIGVGTKDLREVDLCVLVGDTPVDRRVRAPHTMRMVGGRWWGGLRPAETDGSRWVCAAPFGAMAAGTLVAAEAFKVSMRALRDAARVRGDVFDATFAASTDATVRLAAEMTPCPAELGDIDFVSAGAITHAVLYALSRIDGVRVMARAIEPQTYDLPNLNRYALMRRSDIQRVKVEHLAGLPMGGIHVVGIRARYDAALQTTLGGPAKTMLVGVDHIPSRWAAQKAALAASAWLGVGATEHFMTTASWHRTDTACAGCLHDTDVGVEPRAPTASFVSFWSGLWLATMFVQQVAGERLPFSEQAVMSVMLRPDLADSVWTARVERNPRCPVNCQMVAGST